MVSEHAGPIANTRMRPDIQEVAGGILVALMVLSTAAFIATVYLRPEGEVILWADLGLYAASMLFASILAVMRGIRGGSTMHPWFVLAAAMLIYDLGNLLYSMSDTWALPDVVPPLPDLMWLAFYPLAFIGAVLLTKRRLSNRSTYTWLDSLVVGTGTFAVGMAIVSSVIAPGLSLEAEEELIVNSLYLSGDLVLLALVAMVIQAFGGRPPMAWWLLFAGFACFAVADGMYLIQVASDQYVEGAWLDALWPLSGMFIGLAAWLDRAAIPEEAPQHRLSFVAPSLAILAAAGVLASDVQGPMRVVAVGAGVATIVLAVLRLNMDVRDSLKLSAELRRSHVDQLTGLPNRRGLLDNDRDGILPVSLILLDIDSFKDVNDTLGHKAGDLLIQTVAERLTERVGSTHLLARMGGDEFAVLAWGVDGTVASTIAEQLLVALERPLSLDGIPILVTACAGVSTDEEEGDLPSLFREAEVALYAAKVDGPGLVRRHDGSSGEQTTARLRMRAELRADLGGGGEEFVVHYQPIVSIQDGSLLGVEALVRWRRGDRVLPPGVFLPEIIRIGKMDVLTRIVLHRALREVKGLPCNIPVTLNVPPDLMSAWIVEEVRIALDEEQVDADHLVVELTEEAIISNPKEVARVLLELREMGVRSLLDDFGSGWSGLSSLRDFIVDGLKVDGSFVNRLTTDSTALAIVHGIVSLADELGTVVICEGVEDAEILALLQEFSQGFVQGYHLARPMPIADLSRWLLMGHVARHAWPAGLQPISAESEPDVTRDLHA